MSTSHMKRVLLAVDGSFQALEAVRYARAILPAGRTRFVLYHVVTKVPESFLDLEHESAYRYQIVNIGEWEERQNQMIEEFMSHARGLLLDAGVRADDVEATIHFRKEGIARDIIAESQKGYDAVVVGRRGVSELKDMVLGGIANKLIERLSTCPVWVVGGTPVAEKVLICMDGSEGAKRAVQYTAATLAGSSGVTVTLLHVVRGVNIFRQVFGGAFHTEKGGEWAQGANGVIAEAIKAIGPIFDNAREILLNAGLPAERVTQHILSGVSSQAGAILDYAEQEGYGTLVVGRRGLTRVQEFFMGRVSSKVVQLAKDRTVWVVC